MQCPQNALHFDYWLGKSNSCFINKIKCVVVVTISLVWGIDFCASHKARRHSRDLTALFSTLCTTWRWVFPFRHRLIYPRVKKPQQRLKRRICGLEIWFKSYFGEKKIKPSPSTRIKPRIDRYVLYRVRYPLPSLAQINLENINKFWCLGSVIALLCIAKDRNS